MQFRATEVVINLDHLASNLRVLTGILGTGKGSAFVCPMVKANGYGHGDIEVTRHLQKQGIGQVGVSLIEEGLRLRAAGLRLSVLVFGLFDSGAEEILHHSLTPVLSTFTQIENLAKAWKKTGSREPLEVHLKFDTGMGRLGFSLGEVDDLQRALEKFPFFKPVGICTHLHSGEDTFDDKGSSRKQVDSLEQLAQRFEKWQPIVHVWSTASLLAQPQMSPKRAGYGARPGLGIYGSSIGPIPGEPQQTAELRARLKPVMSLNSKIAKINSLSRGQTVSYGATWKAEQDSLVGVVPLGYADGYHRIFSNVGQALVLGQRVPVVGRVCMDYVMVDLTTVASANKSEKHARRGSAADANLLDQEITFFGEDKSGNVLSALEAAETAKTAPWEIMCGISPRVPRRYIGSST